MHRIVFAVRVLTIVPALGIAQLGTSASLSAQQVTLRWKHVAGSQLVYRLVDHQETVESMMGGNEVSEQTRTMRWSVREVAPNGDATVTVTTEHVQLETSGPTGNVSYDSRTDEAPSAPEAQMYAVMAGLSYTMVVGSDGTVKSVQGMEQVIDDMIEALPPEAIVFGEAMLRDMFSEESFTSGMQQTIPIFPKEPVGQGDSWKRSFREPNPMMGEMTTNLEFTVDGIEERDGRTVAVISGTGVMDVDQQAGGQLAGMFGGMMELDDAKMTSTMNFDVGRGLILFTSTTTSMDMALSAGEQQTTVMTVGTNTMELIDYEPGR